MLKSSEIHHSSTAGTSDYAIPDRFVVFQVNLQSFALPVSAVNRIIRAVNPTPVPRSPANIIGIINIHGEMIPLINFRKKFGFSARKIQAKDRMILFQTPDIMMALIAEDVYGLTELTPRHNPPAGIRKPGDDTDITGLLYCEDEVILIYDIEKIFIKDALKTIILHKKVTAGRK
jgi:purine-binding chemotaxis protein CheW